MQASSFWKRFIGTVDSGDLADLRRDMILEVGVVALVIGWLTTLAASGYEGRLEYSPTALILLAGSMASFLLRPTHYQVALHVLIATVLCAIDVSASMPMTMRHKLTLVAPWKAVAVNSSTTHTTCNSPHGFFAWRLVQLPRGADL